MRGQKKNQKDFYYALFDHREDAKDEFGNLTGDTNIVYKNPVLFKASKTSGQGNAEESPFGTDIRYDAVLTCFDTNIPIDENSLIWYKTKPTYNDDETVNTDSADFSVSAPLLDSLNCVRISIKKIVKVTAEEVIEEDKTDTSTDDSETSGDDF